MLDVSPVSPKPYVHHPELHSFPTRRSSDLRVPLLARKKGQHNRLHPRPPERKHLHQALLRTAVGRLLSRDQDRKSTRLNSSHPSISYAVFCLKKKRMSPCAVFRPFSILFAS